MALDPTNIDDVFDHLRDLFNSQKYDEMLPFLDANITWKMLHHADSITGAGQVIQWLKDNKDALNPQLSPVSKKPNPPANEDGSQRVDGTAKWQGRKGAAEENIECHYTFTKSKAGSWVLKNAFGIVLG